MRTSSLLTRCQKFDAFQRTRKKDVFLLLDPICEVNLKNTGEMNVGNEKSWTTLSRRKYSRTLNWTCYLDCRGGIVTEEKFGKNYEAFMLDTRDLKKMAESLVVLEEMDALRDVQIVETQDNDWLEDRSKSELKIDDELHQS